MKTGQNPNSPIRYGSSYKSNTNLAANTPETLFTPAANVNGAVVFMAEYTHADAGLGVGFTFVAKTSAPTTIIDGDVLPMTGAMQGANGAGGIRSLSKPVFIPAGKGLYAISTTAETVCLRSALYNLL